MKTHGKTNTRVYHLWWRMKQACYDEKYGGFKKVGALGIKVCPEWTTFQGFYQSMGDIPADCNALRRLNDKLDFSRDNCEWYFSEKLRTQKAKMMFDRRKPHLKNKKMVRVALDKDIYDTIKGLVPKKNDQDERQVENLLAFTLKELFMPLARSPAPQKTDGT